MLRKLPIGLQCPGLISHVLQNHIGLLVLEVAARTETQQTLLCGTIYRLARAVDAIGRKRKKEARSPLSVPSSPQTHEDDVTNVDPHPLPHLSADMTQSLHAVHAHSVQATVAQHTDDLHSAKPLPEHFLPSSFELRGSQVWQLSEDVVFTSEFGRA